MGWEVKISADPISLLNAYPEPTDSACHQPAAKYGFRIRDLAKTLGR